MADPDIPPIARFAVPPGTEDIVALAERALAAIPTELSRHVQGVGIVVEDMADDETLGAMGIESAWDLTGLYQGRPLIHRGLNDVVGQPDMVILYRQPILLEWIETGEDLFRLVRNVLVHEIAHHFGFSDAEIEALERAID